MRIRYLIPYPFMMDTGGGKALETGVIGGLQKMGNEVLPFDWIAGKADFEVLLAFGFTHHNSQLLDFIRNMGILVVIIPIFDRLKPRFLHRAGSVIGGYDRIRLRNLQASDLVVVNNRFEAEDIHKIYGIPKEKIMVNLLGLPESFFEMADRVSADLFIQKFGVRDFVYYPSARISRRKNQITFLKALGGTKIPVVITGRNAVEAGLENALAALLKKSPNVLCIDTQNLDIHLSAYKAAKVSVSVSLSETAGLVNLEAAYLGCNLVLSDHPVFREYIGEFADYVSPKKVHAVRKAVENSMLKDFRPEARERVRSQFTWDRYCRVLMEKMASL